MGDAIVRQWLVLSMLPTPPRRIDAASIEARLRERGVDVHRRTIQRDLIELSQVFPIVADLRSKPYGWRWSEESPILGRILRRPVGTGLRVRLRAVRERLVSVLHRLGATDMRFTGGDPAAVDASVVDLEETRALLLGHADHVEVLAPPELRREIAARARRALTVHEG